MPQNYACTFGNKCFNWRIESDTLNFSIYNYSERRFVTNDTMNDFYVTIPDYEHRFDAIPNVNSAGGKRAGAKLLFNEVGAHVIASFLESSYLRPDSRLDGGSDTRCPKRPGSNHSHSGYYLVISTRN